MAVGPANRNDFKLARETLENIEVDRPTPDAAHPQGMCLDKNYDQGEIYELLQEFGFTAHVRVRGEEAQALKRNARTKARRWVVERSHSWLNRFRAILHPLEQESPKLPRLPPPGTRHHHLAPNLPSEIGS